MSHAIDGSDPATACNDVSSEWRKVGSKGENRMRFEIFEPNPEKEVATRLRLVKVGDTINLQAVDKNGDRLVSGDILGVKPNGIIHLYNYVNEELGLKPAEEGRVVVENY
ncbi:hypothetical protein LCGC14_1388040 [marine sediment metagenome]|uniref:Uncharacterized protein n=1 Tax=marine sediment metagenome TaxID=412755 RepID=A0A0F9K0X0_9ZZZZ